MLTCEVHRCSEPARYRVGNARGEGIRVCVSHRDEVSCTLVAPVVIPLELEATIWVGPSDVEKLNSLASAVLRSGGTVIVPERKP